MSGSGGGGKDNRADEFKRATAGALRAIARTTDVQVAFQPGPSGLAGKRARLPLPTRALPAAEMARLRGAADSLALKLRHHDDAVHAARMPGRREAKDVYDALEQARVEVVGSRHMAGVASNLRSRLAEECEAEGFDRMTRRDQLPMAAALSMLMRERMSGEASPQSAAARVLDLWRDTLGSVRRRCASRKWPSGRTTRPALPAPPASCWPPSISPRRRWRPSPTTARRARTAASRPDNRTTPRRATARARPRPSPCSARSPRRPRERRAEDDSADPSDEDSRRRRRRRPPGRPPAAAGKTRVQDTEAAYRAFTRAHDEEIAAEEPV